MIQEVQMNNRFKVAAVGSASKLTGQFHALCVALGTALQPYRAAAQQAIMGLGVLAMAALVLMFFKPELTDELKELSPFSSAYDEDSTAQTLAFAELLKLDEATTVRFGTQNQSSKTSLFDEAGNQRPLNANALTDHSKEQQRITAWLAKRYRVAASASGMLVEAAYSAAREVRIDPLLVLAVMAIESRLNPFAESAVGAQGLMQVMSKVHSEKFESHGGVTAALNPVANIKVGALILKDYVRRGGSLEAGLKLYVGAGNLEGDGGYGQKVVAEYQRLQAVASGKRVPTFTPPTLAQPVDEAKAVQAQPETVDVDPA